MNQLFTYFFCHESDFGIVAEWHFLLRRMARGPCDGVGGQLNGWLHEPAYSDHNYDSQIMTQHQLFDFAEANIPSVTFYYATTEQHEQEAILLRIGLIQHGQ